MISRILIALLLLAGTAHAEPRRTAEQVVPVGTRVQVGDEASLVVGEDMLLINVSTGRKANAARRLAEKLEQDLRACARDAAIVKEPPSPFWTAVRWTSVGLAIGGAFALGVLVR